MARDRIGGDMFWPAGLRFVFLFSNRDYFLDRDYLEGVECPGDVET